MSAISVELKPVAMTRSSREVTPSIRDSTNASSGPIGSSRTLTPLTNASVVASASSSSSLSPATIENLAPSPNLVRYPVDSAIRLDCELTLALNRRASELETRGHPLETMR